MPGPAQSCQTTVGLRGRCKCGTGLWTPPPSLLLDSADGSTLPALSDAQEQAFHSWCLKVLTFLVDKNGKVINPNLVILLCLCLPRMLLQWQLITLWDKWSTYFVSKGSKRCARQRKKRTKRACSLSSEDLLFRWFQNNKHFWKAKLPKCIKIRREKQQFKTNWGIVAITVLYWVLKGFNSK